MALATRSLDVLNQAPRAFRAGVPAGRKALLDPGDRVWLEDPGYNGARGAFAAAGAVSVSVPVDDEGLAGMTLLGWLPQGTNDVVAAQAAKELKVDVLSLSSFAIRPIRSGLLLGYAGVCEREIKDGTSRLAQALA